MNKLALKIKEISDSSGTELLQDNMVIITHKVRKFGVASHTDNKDAVVQR
jgi:hypothetical protein